MSHEAPNAEPNAEPAPSAAGFLPPELTGTMPRQNLSDAAAEGTRHVPIHPEHGLAPAMRRAFIFGGAALVSGIAINEMRLVLNVDGLTILEIVVLVLFALNTIWISLSVPMAIAGFVRLLFRRNRTAEAGPLTSRTALLMPLYNEEPARAAAALDAMASDLAARGAGGHFDLFILSDTTDGDIALAEEEAVWALRLRLSEGLSIYYRRRERNIAHKSGNIREFCERWGRAYDHFLVLDADSLMEGATIIELVRRMENDPDAGLIQTVPRLYQGTTLVARLQQFAARVYGPVLASGLAWWTGREGNFWGHNAVIRTRAFMESCGLPELPGRPPLGGPILSHDFVEAALLRRTGWSVRVADDLQGSYEACPATLVDLAIRDRRWCQGNLQHARVLGAKGLHWVSRFHLLSGIFSFVSSPVWLLFLLAALALGVQNEFAPRPEYFTRSFSLFPVWPHIDPVRALRTFILSLAILGAPKVLGVLAFAASGKRLRAGGGLLLPFSVAFELVLSALLAPILMLIHCGLVASILAGRHSGWSPQRRGDQSLPWTEVAYRHRWHVVAGVVLALVGYSISWQMAGWLLPAALGMVAAVPLSLFTGSSSVGRWHRRLRLLRTPEEAAPPAIERTMNVTYPLYRDAVARAPDLVAIAVDSEKLRRHLALTDPSPGRSKEIDATKATADLKVRSAETLEDAVAHLTPRERAHVQSAPELLSLLSRLPRRGTALPSRNA